MLNGEPVEHNACKMTRRIFSSQKLNNLPLTVLVVGLSFVFIVMRLVGNEDLEIIGSKSQNVHYGSMNLEGGSLAQGREGGSN